MKKILLVAAILVAATTLRAQTQFGVRAGVNFNHFNLHNSDEKLEGNSTGFHAGVLVWHQISSNFAISPGLQFSLRGGSFDEGENIDVKLSNIELPINFLYTNMGFYAGAGPSFHYGVSGRYEAGGDHLDAYSDNTSGLQLKRFEIGANVLVGYKLTSGLFFDANYTPGLTSIYDGGADGIKGHTSTFGISVGYLFAGKPAAKSMAKGKSKSTKH